MTVMFTVHGRKARAPTLVEAATELHVAVECLDGRYGVHLVDPFDRVYVVRSNDPRLADRADAQADMPIDVFG
jgi:hypothetical protein